MAPQPQQRRIVKARRPKGTAPIAAATALGDDAIVAPQRMRHATSSTVGQVALPTTYATPKSKGSIQRGAQLSLTASCDEWKALVSASGVSGSDAAVASVSKQQDKTGQEKDEESKPHTKPLSIDELIAQMTEECTVGTVKPLIGDSAESLAGRFLNFHHTMGLWNPFVTKEYPNVIQLQWKGQQGEINRFSDPVLLQHLLDSMDPSSLHPLCRHLIVCYWITPDALLLPLPECDDSTADTRKNPTESFPPDMVHPLRLWLRFSYKHDFVICACTQAQAAEAAMILIRLPSDPKDPKKHIKVHCDIQPTTNDVFPRQTSTRFNMQAHDEFLFCPFSVAQLQEIVKHCGSQLRHIKWRCKFTVEQSRVLAAGLEEWSFNEYIFADGGEAFVEEWLARFRNGNTANMPDRLYFNHFTKSEFPFMHQHWIRLLTTLQDDEEMKAARNSTEIRLSYREPLSNTAFEALLRTRLKCLSLGNQYRVLEAHGHLMARLLREGRGPQNLDLLHFENSQVDCGRQIMGALEHPDCRLEGLQLGADWFYHSIGPSVIHMLQVNTSLKFLEVPPSIGKSSFKSVLEAIARHPSLESAVVSSDNYQVGRTREERAAYKEGLIRYFAAALTRSSMTSKLVELNPPRFDRISEKNAVNSWNESVIPLLRQNLYREKWRSIRTIEDRRLKSILAGMGLARIAQNGHLSLLMMKLRTNDASVLDCFQVPR